MGGESRFVPTCLCAAAIRANQARHKVYVSLEADAPSLFPAIVGGGVVRREEEETGRAVIGSERDSGAELVNAAALSSITPMLMPHRQAVENIAAQPPHGQEAIHQADEARIV